MSHDYLDVYYVYTLRRQSIICNILINSINNSKQSKIWGIKSKKSDNVYNNWHQATTKIKI